MAYNHAHTTVTDIFQVLSSANEGVLYSIAKLGRPEGKSEVMAKELQPIELGTIPVDSSTELSRASAYLDQELPDSYESAVTGIESKDWIEATDNELNGLKKLKTWSVGDLPINKKALRLRWCFTKKSTKFKARIVVKGFMQLFGVDYNETFSPVARYTTIRLFLALCALLSLTINQMDVDYACVNADLEEDVDIWCHPLAGMNVPKGKYIRLNKALYGLKQSARQ